MRAPIFRRDPSPPPLTIQAPWAWSPVAKMAIKILGLAGLLFILPIMMNFLPVSWHRDAIAQWLPSNAGMQIVEKVTQPLQFSPWAGLAVFAVSVALDRKQRSATATLADAVL